MMVYLVGYRSILPCPAMSAVESHFMFLLYLHEYHSTKVGLSPTIYRIRVDIYFIKPLVSMWVPSYDPYVVEAEIPALVAIFNASTCWVLPNWRSTCSVLQKQRIGANQWRGPDARHPWHNARTPAISCRRGGSTWRPEIKNAVGDVRGADCVLPRLELVLPMSTTFELATPQREKPHLKTVSYFCVEWYKRGQCHVQWALGLLWNIVSRKKCSNCRKK